MTNNQKVEINTTVKEKKLLWVINWFEKKTEETIETDIMLVLTFEDIIGIYVSVVYIRPLVKPINDRESSSISNKDFCMES